MELKGRVSIARAAPYKLTDSFELSSLAAVDILENVYSRNEYLIQQCVEALERRR